MPKRILIVISSAIFILAAAFAAGRAGAPLRKVVFMPQWLAQAQFAGYYAAKEAGIYEKHGLDVTILDGGPDAPSVGALADRKAEFITMQLSAAVAKRAEGMKLVNIGQIMSRSALLFVARKSSGILAPKDMSGKKVGYWQSDFQGIPRAFFKKYGIDANFFPINYTVDMFLAGGIDAMTVMWYNEYHKIISSGVNPDELTTFFFFDHDLNFPEDGIYCLEETLASDPDTCKRFVEASIEGWKYAFENEPRTLSIVIERMKKAHLAANRAQQRWMLARMRDLIVPTRPGHIIGQLEESDYDKLVNILFDSGAIKEKPAFGTFHRSAVKNASK